MKKILFSLFSLVTIAAQAQTADEIIQKYTDNIGGLDNFKKVTTAKISGIFSGQGMDFPLTTQIINGKAMRTDVEVMGQAIVNCYKDGKGWKINPFAGAETATDVTGAELNDFKDQSSLATPLMDYKSRGNKIELLGQEDVEGVKTFKIKMTTAADSKVTTYFVDASTYLIIKTVSSRDIQGQATEIASFFSDYKTYGGLKFAMSRVSKIAGETFQTVTFNNVELNVAIDEKIFDK